MQLTDFLPTTLKEVRQRGWDYLDVILFSGDAYVDHPSFGAAVIGRILEAEGYRVAIVPQPDWHGDFRDFKKLGRPRLFFGIAPGCMDSMVNKYTANRRLRSEDAYSPDGRHDMRPEYPTIVYSQILKQIYPDVPVVLGGDRSQSSPPYPLRLLERYPQTLHTQGEWGRPYYIRHGRTTHACALPAFGGQSATSRARCLCGCYRFSEHRWKIPRFANRHDGERKRSSRRYNG